MLWNRVSQLQEALRTGVTGTNHRHDHTHQQPLFSGFDCGILFVLAHLGKQYRCRRQGFRPGTRGTGAGNQLAIVSEQHNSISPHLLSHALYHLGLELRWYFREIGAHQPGLYFQIQQHRIQNRAAKLQSALQRAIDAHIEPGFDALAEKLNRYRVHQRPRQYRDHREHHQHAKSQQ